MISEDGEFERQVRGALEDSVDRLDGRVRSRLTRARYAALEARPGSARAAWRGWAPAGTVAGSLAASLVVALVMFSHPRPGSGVHPPVPAQVAEAVPAQPAFEDLELLADNDAIELPNADDYDFYEWAAAQGTGGGEKVGS
jgi:hypothetical protein